MLFRSHNLVDDQSYTEEFDYVVVASGHFSTPNVPNYEGFSHFNGRILHAHDFRDALEFEGQLIRRPSSIQVSFLSHIILLVKSETVPSPLSTKSTFLIVFSVILLTSLKTHYFLLARAANF